MYYREDVHNIRDVLFLRKQNFQMRQSPIKRPSFKGWALNRRGCLISAGRLLNIEEITWVLIRGGRLKNAGRLIGSLR